MRRSIRGAWLFAAVAVGGCGDSAGQCEDGTCAGGSSGDAATAGESTAEGSSSGGVPTSSGSSGPASETSSGEGTSETSSEGTSGVGTETGATSGETGGVVGSAGCGKPADQPVGGVQLEIDAGPEGDGLRSYYLELPAGYDPQVPHRLVVGYAGTNWTGEMIQPYLDLEGVAGDGVPEIFVYPDPLWRDFEGWGNLGGWVLGPHAAPAHGDGDLVFTERLIDHLGESYCIDESKVFATGHSWGGDMAMVAACFLGERFAAAVPVAANRPYWFESGPDALVDCPGDAAVWTFFGVADDHFTSQDYPGQYGDECRDFWVGEHACAGVDAAEDLGLGGPGECVQYQGCASETRYCLYAAEFGHQVPDYYSEATMQWFRSL